MNEEEKAIERCKELIKPEHSNWIGISNQKAIETVLNLIDKQNKELNKLKSKNKELLRKLRNRVKENNKLIKYSNYKKEFSTLNKQIDKQNKVIDEMSEQLAGLTIWDRNKEYPLILGDKEELKQYFIRKVEEDE